MVRILGSAVRLVCEAICKEKLILTCNRFLMMARPSLRPLRHIILPVVDAACWARLRLLVGRRSG